MATSRNAKDILLAAMVTAEVQNTLQDEIPKLAEILAKRVYEKVKKWSDMNKEIEQVEMEEVDTTAREC